MFYTRKQSLRARILVAAVSLFMVFGNVVTPLSGTFYVFAEDDAAVAEASDATAGDAATAADADTDADVNEDADADTDANDAADKANAAAADDQTNDGTDQAKEENTRTAADENAAGVTTWEDLEKAINGGTDAVITVTGKLTATSTITVNREVKLVGDGDAKIFAGKNDTMFVVESGNLTLGSGLTLYGLTEEHLQKCDSDSVIKGFTGTIDSPKGFFVQVDKEGTLNIEGAVLRDFITDENTMYAAPVVVIGGKFNMTDGQITHNSVGYTADNSKSGLPADDKDKKYDSDEYIGMDSEDASHAYESKGLLGHWNKTETAGALILSAGAEGTVSGNSKLNGNRADTGAVVVQGAADKAGATDAYEGKVSELRISGNTQINENVGVHHAGAVFIFNGGKVVLENGVMSGNFAWNKGGAVWASEEAYGSSNFKNRRGERQAAGEATFIMHGGKLTNNMAVNRGGAIEVMSNHVAILGGEITGNACRVIGGAIYVEGDGPDRMYKLYIPKGNITENEALSPMQEKKKAESEKLFRTLEDNGNGCNFSNKYSNTPATGEIADFAGYDMYFGHGGGIWLCPFGGNITINIDENNPVYIGGNKATNSNNGRFNYHKDPAGQDILVRTFNTGQGNGIDLEKSGEYNVFKEEDRSGNLAEKPLAEPNFYPGPIGVTNTQNENKVEGGVLISGNVAANGGAIGSNGMVLFGAAKPKYLAELSFEVGKRWSKNLSEEERNKEIRIELWLEEDGKKVQRLQPQNEDGSIPTLVQVEDIVLQGENLTREVKIPLPYNVNDEPFNFVTLSIEGVAESKDVANPAHLADIYDAIKANKKISVKEWHVLVVEKIDNKETEYKLPADGATLKSIGINEDDVVLEEGGEISFSTRRIEIEVGEVIGNDSEPAIEKYVNQAVHQDIKLDTVFDYDILAYVPMDADKVKIKDTLVEDLEFVSKEDEVTVIDLGDENNHEVNYDISGKATNLNGTVGTAASEDNAVAHKTSIDADTRTLTVELNDEEVARRSFN